MQCGVVLLAVHVRGGIASANGVVFLYSAVGINALLALPYCLILSQGSSHKYFLHLCVMVLQQFVTCAVLLSAALFAKPDQRYLYLYASFTSFMVRPILAVLMRMGMRLVTVPRPPPLDLEHYVERLG